MAAPTYQKITPPKAGSRVTVDGFASLGVEQLPLDLGEPLPSRVETRADAGHGPLHRPGIFEVPARDRLGRDAGVRVVDIAPPDRQHRVDHVISRVIEVRIERVEEPHVASHPRCPTCRKQHVRRGADAVAKARRDQRHLVPPPAQAGGQVERIPLGPAPGGIGVEDD